MSVTRTVHLVLIILNLVVASAKLAMKLCQNAATVLQAWGWLRMRMGNAIDVSEVDIYWGYFSCEWEILAL